jgi:hypothetical protein
LSTERTSTTGFNPAITVAGGWKEVGRTTLGSSASNVTVASLPNKRYYMILRSILPTGQIDIDMRFNSDSNNNYARRWNGNGGADGTATSQNFICSHNQGGAQVPLFAVEYVANLPSKEKLCISHLVQVGVAGAGTAPSRGEEVGKWTNTSDSIDEVEMNEGRAGSYNTGTEIVVLGWDPADTHTTNFWEELASVSGDGSSTTLSTGTVIDKKYIWIQAYLETTGQMKGDFRVGNGSVDGAGTYAFRISNNGGADAAHDVKASLTEDMPNALHHFVNIFAINNASNEGLFIGHDTGVVTTGAGTAPTRQEFVSKWANTSNQFNILDVVSGAGDGNWSSKSILKVWGSN